MGPTGDQQINYGIKGEADAGTLLLDSFLYTKPDLKSRKAVLGSDHRTESDHYTRKGEMIDIVADPDFEGDRGDARELVSPPIADLLHQNSGTEDLRERRESTDRDRYFVRFYGDPIKADDELLGYLEQSDFYFMVNPVDARETAAYKDQSHDLLEENDIPTIPTVDAEEAVDRGESYVLKQVGELDRGWVMKAANSSGGRHQWHVTDWDELLERYDDKNIDEASGDYILQPFIPHGESHRWMTYGGEVRTGMIRRSQEDYRTNVSNGELTEKSAIEALKDERVAPLQPDGQTELELAEDAAGAMIDRHADPELETPNIITSVDLMVADLDDLEGLPDSYLDSVEKYSGEESYLVTEFESLPGGMIDHMYMWQGPRSGMPALQEAVFLEELAGNEPGKPEEIADDIQDRIWARVRSYYRSPERMLTEKIKTEMMNSGEGTDDTFTGP